MTVEKNGQLAWTFEEIDLTGALEEVSKEYDILREQLRHTSSYPKVHKTLIKRCNLLLEIRYNIFKLIERGLY